MSLARSFLGLGWLPYLKQTVQYLPAHIVPMRRKDARVKQFVGTPGDLVLGGKILI